MAKNQFAFCPYCGAKLTVNDVICPNCGKKLPEHEQSKPSYNQLFGNPYKEG
ncbi:zinc ribbon domain-containing protein [Lentilactobacillus kisonensis]|nr:zinc-ribbon domain-containing protein [Lentilactobacillus kisonensis]